LVLAQSVPAVHSRHPLAPVEHVSITLPLHCVAPALEHASVQLGTHAAAPLEASHACAGESAAQSVVSVHARHPFEPVLQV
jgi:hypothetical protein